MFINDITPAPPDKVTCLHGDQGPINTPSDGARHKSSGQLQALPGQVAVMAWSCLLCLIGLSRLKGNHS